MTELLFVHGILGKPDYFDFLRPRLPADVRPTSILLDGHGRGPREFAATSMARWRRQVAEAVESLRSTGNRVVVVAHSMGCLFAIDAAVRGEADALFLLNPPMSLRVTRRLLLTPLKVRSGEINDAWTRAAKAAYSISDDSNILHYAGWIPRYLELFGEIRRTRSVVKALAVPTRVYLSAHDEMVSPRSSRLFPGRPEIQVKMLPDSGHYYYTDSDRSVIISDFSEFLSVFGFKSN